MNEWRARSREATAVTPVWIDATERGLSMIDTEDLI